MRSTIVFLTISLMLLSCKNSSLHESGNTKSYFHKISNDSLLTLVEYQTFQYFWDGAEPVSGMARERYHVNNIYEGNDKNIVTTGGTGFGVMALIVGVERGFITRKQGYDRLYQIVDYLEKADRFHGAWPHWLHGETGRVKPFTEKDNGADLVETSFLMQGLLAVRQYFTDGSPEEKALASKIDTLWKEVEWNWFTKNNEKALYWHWSPEYGWSYNQLIRGNNECLISYILAASSPTYSISAEVYHEGWADQETIGSVHEKYGYKLMLNSIYPEYGGPLFWTHYSFLGLDPRGLKDKYADYWDQNKNQTLINRQWCIENPLQYKGYSARCWGLTASYSTNGYAVHAPGPRYDLGVISPTAALSSFPYTPKFSMEALKYFYYQLGSRIFGEYGFYDAFSEQYVWFPQKYLAIDQGPIISMIENHRTQLLWNLFMSSPEIKQGLKKLGFESPKI